MCSVSKKLISGIGASALGFFIAGSFGGGAWAQAPAAAPARFAAVSIRPYRKGPRPVASSAAFSSDPAGLHIAGRPFSQIICYAYGIDAFQLIGGPAWLQRGPNHDYNIDATTSAPATGAQMRAMLRQALAERLGLKLVRQEKPAKVLSLEVAKSGLKMRTLRPGEQPQFFSRQPGTATLRFETTQDFVKFYDDGGIARYLGRPLVDNTDLTGRYDVELVYRRMPRPGGGSRFNVEAMPKVVQRLGLVLRPIVAPMAFYTIASVHRPTAN